ncbi:purine-cytosine permease family protein [Maribacter sp. 2307ULW6-5]|uniref:purine-cytosine permease family protein n=1 Tax=Maribacter sp. 2307ULW6-5 TaxID=3386275 RepID=UPI0039BD2A03
MSENKGSLQQRLTQVNEYERQPVPKKSVKGFKSFVGMVAGEHIAGTEFIIGPLFVLHGVGILDIFLGLFIGNLLATLSWTLVCAPAAVKTRLTIFYQLEKISGVGLVSIYNIINGILFCVTASAMIGVSASAVGLLLNVEGPGLTDLYPTSFLWIVIIFCIGLVITVVATFGFDRVSKFANIFAPWMPLVFLASGIAMLPGLGITSLDTFWALAEEKIWTGVPVEGQTKYTLWHVIIFAWLCNSSMHLGLADMSIYRYAKKSYYGLASAFGMFIGHYMAWIASGILCAVALQNGNMNPTPGEIAFMGAGLAGAICVVVAGWTTANPTIYRAGLAVQALLPTFKRWKVTMIVGVTATVMACSPAIISKLDQFLGLYALLASPVGAVVIMDIFVFPKVGLRQNLAELKKMRVNISVLLAWSVALFASYVIYERTNADFYFFVAVPGWIIGGLSYLMFAFLQQRYFIATSKGDSPGSPHKKWDYEAS